MQISTRTSTIAIAAALTLSVAALYSHYNQWQWFGTDAAVSVGPPGNPEDDPVDLMDTPMGMEGISEPSFAMTSDTVLDDNENVVVVKIDEQVRGYPIAHLMGMGEHVVNDMFQASAVTVIHCDRMNCTRVFAGKSEALTVATAGWMNGRMAITVAGSTFPLDSKRIPLRDLPFTVERWKDFKMHYPNSEVYLGAPDFEKS